MNILITGGAGFIGSHLAEALLAEGHCVTALDDVFRESTNSNEASAKPLGRGVLGGGCLPGGQAGSAVGFFGAAAALLWRKTRWQRH